MPSVRVSSFAAQDLRDIARYIARDDRAAAKRWRERIQKLFDLLASQPEIGMRLRASDDQVRVHSSGNYVVYYQPASWGILVVRVLHAAREQHDVY